MIQLSSVFSFHLSFIWSLIYSYPMVSHDSSYNVMYFYKSELSLVVYELRIRIWFTARNRDFYWINPQSYVGSRRCVHYSLCSFSSWFGSLGINSARGLIFPYLFLHFLLYPKAVSLLHLYLQEFL